MIEFKGMSKISVILAVFNEEENIEACLKTVKGWVDEIVVVDGSSSDKTAELAKRYTKRVFIRDNPVMFHKNKQYAIDKATGDWILYLDADERVEKPLREEILKIVRKDEFDGYFIPRKNIIFGKWIKNSLWHPDYNLRLFRRDKGRLPCKNVHEQPEVKGKVGRLENYLLHYNYQTVSQFVRHINDRYSENDRNVFLKEGKKIHWYDAVRFPVNDFFSTFFARQGYKDGLHGLVLSLLQAFSALVTFAKIWEAQGFKEENPTNFLDKMRVELKYSRKGFTYWWANSKLEETGNPFKKLVLRFVRKVSS